MSISKQIFNCISEKSIHLYSIAYSAILLGAIFLLFAKTSFVGTILIALGISMRFSKGIVLSAYFVLNNPHELLNFVIGTMVAIMCLINGIKATVFFISLFIISFAIEGFNSR